MPLGRGGMGQVWEAVERASGRRVAVKLVTHEVIADRSDPAELIRRFSREVSVTAGLGHPGVPAVHDTGIYEEGLYLVMDLVEGCTIDELIAERGALPYAEAATIAAQVCSVLAVAHERGLVHRDIKPQNLMLADDGAVKVLDFGVAAVLESPGAARITQTGTPIGTLAYMAPEQLRGERVVPRTDLYALGCVLYEMLTGRRVFEAPSPHAVGYQHLERRPDPIGRPDVPRALEHLVQRLLAKDPGQRPADANEVLTLLQPFSTPPMPPADLPLPHTPAARPNAPAEEYGAAEPNDAAWQGNAAGHGESPPRNGASGGRSDTDRIGPRADRVGSEDGVWFGAGGEGGGADSGRVLRPRRRTGRSAGAGFRLPPVARRFPGLAARWPRRYPALASRWARRYPTLASRRKDSNPALASRHKGSDPALEARRRDSLTALPPRRKRSVPALAGRSECRLRGLGVWWGRGGRPGAGVAWTVLHSLWVLPTFTMGLFPWAAFLYIALRHRHRAWLVTALVYLGLTIAELTLILATPNVDPDHGGSSIPAIFTVVLTFSAPVHAFIVNVERLRLRALPGLGRR
ncbi:protein kinase [Actinomadura yumaensis]|uniref:serine/threonine-protein kinase n=1 Tax=Actinomadura yumaensis TaxID=111807 RepID=UPI0036206B1B